MRTSDGQRALPLPTLREELAARTGGDRTSSDLSVLEGRPPIDPTRCTAIVVDDGLATGASAKAALAAVKRRGAARVVLAIFLSRQYLSWLRCRATRTRSSVDPAKQFFGVGVFYRDFHQLTDEETIGLLRQAWAERADAVSSAQVGLSARAVEFRRSA